MGERFSPDSAWELGNGVVAICRGDRRWPEGDALCGCGEQARAMGVEERAVPVLEHVLKYHKVTNGDVQKMLGGSKPTATRILQKLDVVLELVGHGVGSYYRIRNY